ncbi:ADP-ribosylation factor-binding protein GGA1 [Aplysia californica]|uniref:ADP-ribosylation factor-binding protein GGA1 n=1 Tax=Aplysia californica TaxID=6500 RepID=A0ABM0JEK2_APLCA|nr:ADP-ribosylation factor-binding protein GGA1 [Aplysia californica]
MATSDDTLEILLNRATDPSMKEEDWDKITAFCNKVNAELEGPLLSTRLIAHKIQSPQEKEALFALSTLEACVNECGRYFHQEIGKFRFLNEIIKVVSPKYLGNRTAERVKTRCIETLYSWHRGLTHEPKITEAYKMLKAQGIIKEDPTYVDKTFSPFPPLKPRKADFEDDEKAKTLEKLLRSKNPDDLQAANRLIKNMVKEDMEKTEKRSRRINELESVRNQVKLLTEMISHFSAASSSKEDMEMMKELFENLEKQRPSLIRLASDTDENDNDGINDILEANDSVTRVMTMYKQTVEGVAPAGDYSAGAKDSSLLDLGLDSGANRAVGNTAGNTPAAASSSAALLENDFKSLGLGDMNELGSIFNSAPGTQSQQQQQQQAMASSVPVAQAPGFGMQATPYGFGQQGFMGLATAQPPQGASAAFPQGPPPVYSAISHNVGPTSSSSAASANPPANLVNSNGATWTAATASGGKESSNTNSSLADLDILDKSLQDYKLNKETFPVKTPQVKMSLNQMGSVKSSEATSSGTSPASAFQPPPSSIMVGQVLQPNSPSDGLLKPTVSSNGDFTAMVSAPPEPKLDLLPLTDVFVPLEKIQPAPGIPSVTAYEKNGLKVVVHFGKDRPRPDVLTMVVSSLSTSSSPITGFIFQAAVPKTMKVKLQPPSASDFPAHNPILPPTAITQVMLVANPKKEKVRLKYKLSYTADGKQVSDVGDIDGIPVQ